MTFLAEEPFSKRRRAVKVFAVTLMNAKSPAIGEIKTIGDKTASSPMGTVANALAVLKIRRK